MGTMSLPCVHILSTGGTISARTENSVQTTGYTASTIGVHELIDAVPLITRFAEIKGEQITNLLSHSLTFDILARLANRINALLCTPQVDGIVVTHGTNTLEETAFFLNLVVKSTKPVVLTAAMRPASAVSADGPANLLNAVCLAASQDSHGRGVLVTMNDQIHSGRDVVKTHTTALDAFKTLELGVLGVMHEGTPHFFRQSLRRHTVHSDFNVTGMTTFPRVDIIYCHIHDDLNHLQASVAAGAKGIVAAATGNGMISDVVKDGLIDARRRGLVIVRSSRCGSGSVTRVAQDDENVFVAAGNLNPQKARILSMLALTQTNSPDAIQIIFNEY